MPKLSDQKIIDGLNSDRLESEKILTYLYDAYFSLFYGVRKQVGLTDEELLSIYSDALLDLRNQVLKGKFEGSGTLKSYFSRIFRNKAIDAFRKNTTVKKKAPFLSIEGIELGDEAPNPIQALIEQEDQQGLAQEHGLQKDLLVQAMERLSEKCQRLLMDYLAFELKPREIQKKYEDIKNAHVARTTIYLCRKKLLKAIEELKTA